MISLDAVWKNNSPETATDAAFGQVRRVFVNGALRETRQPARRQVALRQGPASEQVEALAHGLSLLECWQPGETWLSNSVLADRAGLTRPTVSRVAAVLVDLGYMAPNPVRRGSYRLAGATLGLGFGNPLSSPTVSLASPELTRLASELDVYAAIGIQRSDQIQILENATSPWHPNAVTTDVGTLLPICRSVAGLAALSALPLPQVSTMVEPIKRQYGTQWQAVDRQMSRSRHEYARKGYCTAVAILAENVGAVAVPIRTNGSAEMFVLACGMPAREFYSERVERSIAPRMLELAAALAQSVPAY